MAEWPDLVQGMGSEEGGIVFALAMLILIGTMQKRIT